MFDDIGEVIVKLVLESKKLLCRDISAQLGIQPNGHTHDIEDDIIVNNKIVNKRKSTMWSISSENEVTSKDINEHIAYLSKYVENSIDLIKKLDLCCPPFFDIYWTSSYLYGGAGPLFNVESCHFISKMEAEMGFDIYAIETEETINQEIISSVLDVLKIKYQLPRKTLVKIENLLDDHIDSINTETLLEKAILTDNLDQFKKEVLAENSNNLDE